MAMTLTEAAKLSNDILLEGVVETIVKESPILQKMPFIEIVGNGLTYNKELALPTIDFYDVGDTWAESTPTFTQVTATLKIMGGDADVDNFLKATRSNLQDLEAAVIELKAKALRHKFEDNFIYGNASSNPKQFSGIAKLIDIYTASVQVVCAAKGTATGGTLTLYDLDALIDAVKGGKPDMILCSKRTLRQINDLIRVSYGLAVPSKDEFGNSVLEWNGVPIYTSDAILDTHNVASSVDDTTASTDSHAYAFAFGEGALAGLTAPGHITVEPIGSLETKDATRTRIKWYVSLALFSSIKAAALIGISA